MIELTQGYGTRAQCSLIPTSELARGTEMLSRGKSLGKEKLRCLICFDLRGTLGRDDSQVSVLTHVNPGPGGPRPPSALWVSQYHFNEQRKTGGHGLRGQTRHAKVACEPRTGVREPAASAPRVREAQLTTSSTVISGALVS